MFSGTSSGLRNGDLGLKTGVSNYADDAFFSSHLLRVAMAHDVSDHTPQVLPVIPVLPVVRKEIRPHPLQDAAKQQRDDLANRPQQRC